MKTNDILQAVITSYEQGTKREGQQLLSGQKSLASMFLGVSSKWGFLTSPKNGTSSSFLALRIFALSLFLMTM